MMNPWTMFPKEIPVYLSCLLLVLLLVGVVAGELVVVGVALLKISLPNELFLIGCLADIDLSHF